MHEVKQFPSKHFDMKDIGVSLIVKGDRFPLNQCPKNDFEREQIKNISYASVISNIMYVKIPSRNEEMHAYVHANGQPRDDWLF